MASTRYVGWFALLEVACGSDPAGDDASTTGAAAEASSSLDPSGDQSAGPTASSDPADSSGAATASTEGTATSTDGTEDTGAPVGEGGCAGEGAPLTDLEAMIAELPADTWWTAPGTDMRSACPADLDGYYCASVVNAWSGGAWDPIHRQLLIFGGGHGDSPDNTLYAFDLGTLSWSRLTERSSQDLMGADPLPDGQPVSRHSYDGLQYLTQPQRFFAWSGSRWQDGYGTNVTWTYDHEGGWTDMQSEPEGAGAYSNATAYDPATNVVLAHVGSGLQRYDVASNTWTRLTDYGFPPYWPRYAVGGDKRGTIDTSRGLFFVLGGNMFLVYDIAADAHVTDEWITQGGSTFDNAEAVDGHPEQHIVTGGGEIITAGAPGLDYDPAADALVAWAGGGAWRLDLTTKMWTQGTDVGAPPTVNSVGGTFGRWRYVPRVNAFLLVNSVDEDVYVYKHTDACG